MLRLFLALVIACTPILVQPTGAESADAEASCLARRASAQGKYQSCIQKTLAKLLLGSTPQNVPVSLWYEKEIRKCRNKYKETWPKLTAKYPGTTCDAPRFVDNGDGSVSDNLTGLIWQKTDDDGGITDKDNDDYTWSSADGDDSDEDGSVFLSFLATLNAGAGFAGANGWRLPTIAELQTIMLDCESHCIDQGIFGPVRDNGSAIYWSASTDALDPTFALTADLGHDWGAVENFPKTSTPRARAVRGGR